MYGKLALTLAFASSTLVSAINAEPIDAAHQVKPRQTTNPGGPLQSASGSVSVTDVGTTGVLSIQTDTTVLSIQTDTVPGGDDSSATSPASGSETASSASGASSSSETSASASSSVSDAGAAPPRETGFALAAAAAAGFVGAVGAIAAL
ncbi:hypothetical protein F4819DRAFT_462933 [Hypoxylon fuscum]|nr:hypothetical protein F4819DRAFT_462933 [Hypoxylon fuscum]